MKRNRYIKFRVSNEELYNIKARAAKANMTLSDYVRTSAICGKIVLYDTEHIYRFGQELHSIGNNINQIATVANSTKSIYRQDIKDMHSNITKISDGFKEYIQPLKCEEL